MREKIAADLTAQRVYSDAETLKESVSEFKCSGLDEAELKWNSGQRGCYPTSSLSGREHSSEWDVNSEEKEVSPPPPPPPLCCWKEILWEMLSLVALQGTLEAKGEKDPDDPIDTNQAPPPKKHKTHDGQFRLQQKL